MVARPPVGHGDPLDTVRIAQGTLCCTFYANISALPSTQNLQDSH